MEIYYYDSEDPEIEIFKSEEHPDNETAIAARPEGCDIIYTEDEEGNFFTVWHRPRSEPRHMCDAAFGTCIECHNLGR